MLEALSQVTSTAVAARSGKSDGASVGVGDLAHVKPRARRQTVLTGMRSEVFQSPVALWSNNPMTVGAGMGCQPSQPISENI